MIVLGDFNLDFKNKRVISSSKLNTFLNKFSLKQLINDNTRVTNSSASCIDLLFTDTDNITEAGVINYNISDHLPIYMIKKKSRNKIRKTSRTGRSYLHYREEVFNRLLSQADWGSFAVNEDPEELWSIFVNSIIKVLDQICPIRELTVVDNEPDWLTNELLMQMRQRDKAFRKARNTKSHVDWEIARQLRNRVKMDIRTSKANVLETS